MRKDELLLLDCFLKTGKVGYYLLYRKIHNHKD